MMKIDHMSGFYYAGTVNQHLARLVGIYQRGFAAPSLEQAIVDLQGEHAALPEVILCAGHFGFAALQRFSVFLESQPRLTSIPFVIDTEGISMPDRIQLVRSRISDDVIQLNDSDDATLQQKFRFLRKYKTRTTAGSESLRSYNSPPKPGNRFSLKRGFDMLVASILLVLLGPLMIGIAIVIGCESRGPIFYISNRAGRGYRIFRFYKFRTMVAAADRDRDHLAHLNQYSLKAGPFFKVQNDPRVTGFGRFLRNSSLDELPQLINVLLGDMSLVGNRPLPLYEAASLTTDKLAQRFLAPAGMTGLWQIQKRGQVQMSAEERLRLDIAYAAQANFLTDLWIMARTPKALLQKSNA